MVSDFQRLDANSTREDLQGRLERVLAFTHRALGDLDRDAPFWREELDPYLTHADKALVETGLLLLVVARVPDLPESLRDLLDEIAQRLGPMIQTDRDRALLMRFPHSAAAFGIAQLALTELGHHDEVFARLVSGAFASGFVESVERLPYRAMDVRWLRGLLEEGGEPNFDDLLPHSILTSRAHPIQMSLADAYAFTHALMYATDFGRRALPPTLDAERLADVVDAMIAWQLVSGNMDLLGECLLSASFVGHPWSPYAGFGWSVLMATWDHFGFLPSPSFEPSAFVALSEDDRRHYSFRHVYHTMFVAGIVCAAMLCRPSSSRGAEWSMPAGRVDDLAERCRQSVDRAAQFLPRPVGPDALPTNRADLALPGADAQADAEDPETTLRALLLGLGRLPRGADALPARDLRKASLTGSERALVLADGLLIHSIQAYDLPVLAATIATVALGDIPLSSTFRESLAFVLRQQRPSGEIGAHLPTPTNGRSQAPDVETAALARSLHLAVVRLDRDMAAINS